MSSLNLSSPVVQDSIKKMFSKVLQFCPDCICCYCKTDILKGIIITEKTEVITSCPKCKRSFVE